jgi:hypothetical protein
MKRDEGHPTLAAQPETAIAAEASNNIVALQQNSAHHLAVVTPTPGG